LTYLCIADFGTATKLLKVRMRLIRRLEWMRVSQQTLKMPLRYATGDYERNDNKRMKSRGKPLTYIGVIKYFSVGRYRSTDDRKGASAGHGSEPRGAAESFDIPERSGRVKDLRLQFDI
jgi:hypothetical protein